MKKILLLSEVCGHTSTGKICAELADRYLAEGWEVRIAYGRDGYMPERLQKYAVRIGSPFEVRLHAVRTRIWDEHGFGSLRATKKFVEWARDYHPDLLWMHNLHGYYIQVEVLFEWIRQNPDMEVRWTLHDCWAMTGHCAYFSYVGCERWKTHCEHCPQKTSYPSSVWKDNSYQNFERKKRAFQGVGNMTLYVPSKWLADLVRKSYLQNYPIKVEANRIDRNIFRPTDSDFRKRYGLLDKTIILGVAYIWDRRKGLQDFVELSRMLEQGEVIVLVGLSKKQIRSLPAGILGLEKTDSQKKLAEIYSAADVYVNPSREETYGMTCVEACACGTMPIVYEDTACAEIAEEYGGMVVPQNVPALYEAVRKLTGGHPADER